MMENLENQVLTVVTVVSYVVLVAVMAVYVWRSTRPGAKKTGSTFLGVYIETSLLLGVVISTVTMLYMGIVAATGFQRDEQIAAPAAGNEPALVFLAVDADTGPEEVSALAERYGCYASDLMEEYMTASEVPARLVLYVTQEKSVWDETLPFVRAGQNLVLTYTAEDAPRLLCAQLILRSEDGYACCWYYPADFTEYGRETGYNLTVRPSGALLDKTYRPDTAEEVLALAYPAVYPDGLE